MNEEKKFEGEDSRAGAAATGTGEWEGGKLVGEGDDMWMGELLEEDRRPGREPKYSSRREKNASCAQQMSQIEVD